MIYIDVVNATDGDISYELTVSAEGWQMASSIDNPLSVLPVTSTVELEPQASGDFELYTFRTDARAQHRRQSARATLVYHSYQLDIPEGLTALEIELDGGLNDLDLAVKLNQPIENYDEVDFVDTTQDTKTTYRLESPVAGVLYIDVINALEEDAAYRLSARAEGISPSTPESSPIDQDFPSLNLGETLEGSLAGIVDGAQLSDLYLQPRQKPQGFIVTLEADGDLDLVIKHGSEIESYNEQEEGGDWDYRDMSEANNARLRVDAPKPGLWYIDVVNAVNSETAFNYSLRLTTP
ncbi:MAG: hypothetical protein R2865_05035 [Deinococcales bacterium]